MNAGNILDLIAQYMGQASASALVINGVDLGMAGLNAARRFAEQIHEFKYAETNANLVVTSPGSSFSGAFINNSVTVSGTLSPNVAGNFALSGVHNGLPFYTRIVSTVTYFLSYSGTAWNVTTGGFLTGSNYWTFVTVSTNPSGAYTPQGANTGTLTAAIATATIGVKRVKYVSLPIANGDYEVVEFLTNDQFLNRIRMQTGRPVFNSGKTLANLGATLLGNAVAYQNAQMIYLAPSTLSFPITVQLNIVQWMPDYILASDSDFFTQYGSDFLQWQGVLEVNKYFKRYTVRQEGDIDEANVQTLASTALQNLIAWDSGSEQGTSARINPSEGAPQAA